MRVLIAPDKFKGSMTALEAAEAIALGVRDALRAARRDGEADICPIADGGDGTIEVIAHATPGIERLAADVSRPLPGHPASVPFLRFPGVDGVSCAMIEAAQVIGLARIPASERHPEKLWTHGIGEVIRAAVESGCERAIVALGGSATVDGGVGIAEAMGVRFEAPRRRLLQRVTGKDLGDIAAVRTDECDEVFGDIELIGLCDVAVPLLGPNGAARLFGPQKGASAEQVERLEAGLENLVLACAASGLPAEPEAEGAGAAGGIGYGLMAMYCAELYSGAASVLETVLFDTRCAQADLVITGEGRLDHQTMQGKAVGEVLRRAQEASKPVMIVCGDAEPPSLARLTEPSRQGLDAGSIRTLAGMAADGRDPMTQAAELTREAARELVGQWLMDHG